MTSEISTSASRRSHDRSWKMTLEDNAEVYHGSFSAPPAPAKVPAGTALVLDPPTHSLPLWSESSSWSSPRSQVLAAPLTSMHCSPPTAIVVAAASQADRRLSKLPTTPRPVAAPGCAVVHSDATFP